MCLFAGDDVEGLDVGRTRIFARRDGDRQHLVYAMRLDSPAEVAMILPLPVPPGASEDAVEWLDMTGHTDLFRDLETAFAWDPVAPASEDSVAALGPSSELAPLAVVAVGDFIASYVPGRAHFDRLDPRFRLSERVWRSLGGYDDWGFAVVQLRPGAQEVRPIAFSFPTRRARGVYFPTAHVHDGQVHPTAEFEHALFFQGVTRPRAVGAGGSDPILSDGDVAAYVARRSTHGLVEAGRVVDHLQIVGTRRNEDVWVEDLGSPRAQVEGPSRTFAVLDQIACSRPDIPFGRLLLTTEGLYFLPGSEDPHRVHAAEGWIAGAFADDDAASQVDFAATRDLPVAAQIAAHPGVLHLGPTALERASLADERLRVVSDGRLLQFWIGSGTTAVAAATAWCATLGFADATAG